MTGKHWTYAHIVQVDHGKPGRVWSWNEWVTINPDDRPDNVRLVYARDHIGAFMRVLKEHDDGWPLWEPLPTQDEKEQSE